MERTRHSKLVSIIAMLLCIVMFASLFSCGYSEVPDDTDDTTQSSDNTGNKPEDKPTEPEKLESSASAPVTPTEDGTVENDTEFSSEDSKVSAVVPAGTKLENGATSVTLNVKEMENGFAEVTLGQNETKISVDVHISGVAPENTVPAQVYVNNLLSKGLNAGNYRLYHVENGVTIEMKALGANDIPVHNSYKYNPVTGGVCLYLASFSEITVVENEENAWNGGFNYDWYNDAEAEEFVIANADQLAAFGKIVGGMADGYEQNSFTGKTVKLVADINVGDKDNANETLIFYPIGYYYTTDKNADGTEGDVYSTVNSFEGVFDGNGNTISGIYQNTWEIKGDYDAGYYSDAMGLFGYVVGGTIKNLTVDNFSSDGEFTPTGVIAAYAVNSTFENIAITNCNPRVYNTGNGGIVGIGGNSDDTNELKLTLKNITVDNTNKISALWGSWDVACGGIMGMFRGNGLVEFENCHVAAQIDVNNDVCANYQYYWYRYSGMLIGSIRKNTTEGGYTVADTTGITAKNCTYTLGDWNEYWYCELVVNSLASYTHDHQFSRLTKIASLSEIQDENGKWNKEGNFVIPAADNSSATCYHIFKDAEGNLYQHLHDVADATNPNIYESFDLDGNGELDDLKEDRTCYYMPFNQIFNGNGYGVKAHYSFDGCTEKADGPVKSEEKFEALGNVTTYRSGETITLGQLVASVVDDTKLSKISLFAVISQINENDKVSATYSLDLANWENSTITFSEDSTGTAKIVISDYYYCVPTVIYLNADNSVDKFTANSVEAQNAYTQITLGDLFDKIEGVTINNVTATVTAPDGSEITVTGTSADWESKTIDLTKDGTWTIVINDDVDCNVAENSFTVNKVDKFTNKFTGSFLYRVGNKNSVSLGYLFGEVASDVAISSVNVTVENVAGNAAGTFTSNATWTNGSIQFSGTGVVTVTISADGANAVTLNLEIVNANNIASAASSNGTNVVLLQNVAVSADGNANYTNCTVYGNGFTFDVRGGMNQYNSKQGHGIIIANGATLDNLVILGDVYDTYGAYTNQEDYTGAVDATNTIIQNCHISNCAAPVRANGVTIINTTLYGGTVANLIISGGVNTLENVTTVNYNDGRGILGFGIVISDGANESLKLVLNGELKQHNFVCSADADAVPDDNAKKLFNAMFNEAYSSYHFEVDGVTYVNPGILSMVSTFDASDITNNTGNGYKGTTVSYDTGLLGTATGYLYSLPKDGNSVDNSYAEESDPHKSKVQGDYLPTFEFNLGDQALTNDGADDTRYLTGDASGIEALYSNNESPISLDLTKLANVYKYAGTSYAVSVCYKDASGNILGNDAIVSLTASGTLEFTVTDNIFYDKDGKALDKSVVRTYVVPVTVSVKQATVKNATITVTETNLTGTYTAASTFDTSQYLSFNPLEAITVTDYDANGTGTTVDLTANISETTVEYVNTTSGAWGGATITITYTDGRVLKIVLGSTSMNSPGTSNGGKTITVTNGTVKSDGKVAKSSATGGTWPITSYSFKGNSGSTVSTNETVTVTFEDVNSSGSNPCVTPDTLIALADGTQVRVDSLTGNEELLVWNHETGKLEASSIAYIVNHDKEVRETEIVHLYFSDGSEVKVIGEHVFYNATLNKYVAIDTNNAESYTGNSFVALGNGSLAEIELVFVNRTVELTEAYEVVSYKHLTCFTNGVLSTSAYLDKLLNVFDIDAETYAYDAETVQKDIETYGLYTYEDFEGIITEEAFELYNAKYLKVAVGKGYITWEDILELVDIYFDVDVQPIQ